MPAFVVQFGATVMCAHGGQATPTAPNPRVLASGQPIVMFSAPFVIAGCPFVTPGGNGPCVTGQWTVGATRVFSNGQPVVIQSSMSVCAPTGTPMLVVMAQTRVIAT